MRFLRMCPRRACAWPNDTILPVNCCLSLEMPNVMNLTRGGEGSHREEGHEASRIRFVSVGGGRCGLAWRREAYVSRQARYSRCAEIRTQFPGAGRLRTLSAYPVEAYFCLSGFSQLYQLQRLRPSASM